MLLVLKVFAVALFVFSQTVAKEATFQDVTVHGYQVFTHKFEKKIVSADNLKAGIPENALYDTLEIVNSSIPILRENSVTDLEDLDELIFTNDGIEEIEQGAFRNLPLLRKVNLEGNKIQTIKEGVFNGMPISEINLSNNELTEIETNALSNMPNLMYVNLAHNKIAKWNENWFFGDPILTRISLSYNQLETLPSNAFKNLAGDKKFGSVQLKLYLDFSYNKIESLDKTVFSGLAKVGSLWLDHNQLSSIDTDLLEDVDVEYLILNDNKITCLSGDLNKILKASMTNLDGNPWDCSCLEAVNEWNKINEYNVQISYADMECYAQRIRAKMEDLEKRLNEIKNQ